MTDLEQRAAAVGQDLVELLEPGEVVLYWDDNGRRRSVSVDRTTAFVCCVVGMVLFLTAFVYLATIEQDYLPSLFFGAGFLGLGLIFIFQLRRGHQLPPRCDSLITETRLLYWHEDKVPSAVEIPMTEIAAAEELSSDDGSVRIVKRDGSDVVLTGLENSGRFAKLLPVKPELIPPTRAAHFYNMDMIYFLAAQVAFGFVPGLLLIAEILITGTKAEGFEWFYKFLYVFPAAAVICFAGLHVARLSMFLNGWRDHDPEAVRFWLWPRSYDTELERRVLERWFLNPLYRRLASALYSDALGSAATEEADHG